MCLPGLNESNFESESFMSVGGESEIFGKNENGVKPLMVFNKKEIKFSWLINSLNINNKYWLINELRIKIA